MVKRQTIQYALVSETVKKMRKHASADEIYNAIAKDHPTIGRGTVYRNLQRLSEPVSYTHLIPEPHIIKAVYGKARNGRAPNNSFI